MEGGPLYRLAWRLGLPHGAAGSVLLGIAIAILTWLPLLVLSAFADFLPFVHNVATHVRLLVAIPLFFIAQAAFDLRAAQAIHAIVGSRLVPPRQLARFRAMLVQAKRWRQAWPPEAALVIIIGVLIWQGVRVDVSSETWRRTPEGAMRLASLWYALVSLPVFQFLVWRWCVRLLIWSYLLWRINRLDLQLMPTHPDQAGGLGPLGVAHVALAPLNVAIASVTSATIAEEMMHGPPDIQQVALRVAVTVIVSTLFLVAPLLLFLPRLVAAKQRGLLAYGVLATTYTQSFDAKWVRGDAAATEPFLGSADIQSLADMGNSFNVIRQMRFLPIGQNQLLMLAGAALLPAIPLVSFVIPLSELMMRSVKTLLHL